MSSVSASRARATSERKSACRSDKTAGKITRASLSGVSVGDTLDTVGDFLRCEAGLMDEREKQRNADVDREAAQIAASLDEHRDKILGVRSSAVRQLEFEDPANEWRRVISEFFGTFLLVVAGAGAAVVDAKSGGQIGRVASVTAPGLTVMVVILFMGAVSGAHLNPAVTVAFSLRGDFPWRRVPLYIVAQLVGATVACLVLWGIVGKLGMLGATEPGSGTTAMQAMLMELVLTLGLVSTILGTSSGAQNVGFLGALGVGSYIVLAGLWSSPISGASMNPARSFGPDLVLLDFSNYWVYLIGPLAGTLIAVGLAYVLRGPGGGVTGSTSAQGKLGKPTIKRDQP